MKSLYDQNPEVWNSIAEDGKPHLAEMARHHETAADMDRSLGYQNAVSHWIAKRNGIRDASNRRAKEWLASRKMQAVPAQAEVQGAMFLVLCSPECAAKLAKLAPIMGFEMVDV
jgi:hypothetical protein